MSKTIVAKNTISQLIGRLSITAGGFLVALIIAGKYGVQGFGEFTTITVLISFGYLFVDFGLNASYLKLDEKKHYFTDFLLLRLMLGVVSTMLLILPVIIASLFGVTLFSITPPFFPGLIIFSLTILTQAVLITCSALFQMQKTYQLQIYALIPGAILLVTLSWLVSRSGIGLIGIYGAYVIGGVVSAAICLYLLRRSLLIRKPDTVFASSLIKKGIPLGLLLVFNLIYFRIDILMLSALKGPDAVGIYGYAYRYFDFALTVPLFLSNSLYPFLLKNQKNVRKGKVNEREYFFIFLIIGIIGAIIGYAFSPLISFVNPGFEESVVVLRILSVSLPLFFLTSYMQWLLIARDKEGGLLRIYLGIAVVNVILNFIFLPSHSYLAAAVITGVCEAIVFLFLFYTLHSTKNFRKAS